MARSQTRSHATSGSQRVPPVLNAKRQTLFGVCERGIAGALRLSLALQ
jgi:hypothetical protein